MYKLKKNEHGIKPNINKLKNYLTKKMLNFIIKCYNLEYLNKNCCKKSCVFLFLFIRTDHLI